MVAGREVTMIKSIFIEGCSNISNLSIINNKPSLIITNLNNQDPDQNVVLFNKVKILAKNISNINNKPQYVPIGTYLV
jgi:hypothetical protein